MPDPTHANSSFDLKCPYGQKTHPALLVSKKLKFFNEDEFIEGTGVGLEGFRWQRAADTESVGHGRGRVRFPRPCNYQGQDETYFRTFFGELLEYLTLRGKWVFEGTDTVKGKSIIP